MTLVDVEADRGKLIVVTGAMNSNKTGAMIVELDQIENHTDYHAVTFTNDINTRDGTSKISSNGGRLEFPAKLVKVAEPTGIINRIHEEDKKQFVDVIGIDEGNFYDYELIPILEYLRDEGRVLMVSGLNRNFRGEPFTPMDKIMFIADKVKVFTSRCKIRKRGKQCSRPAQYTVRMRTNTANKKDFYDKDGTLISNFGFAPYYDPTILAEGSSEDVKYTVACKECFRIPGKEKVSALEEKILSGEKMKNAEETDKILEFLISEKRWTLKDGKYSPRNYRYDTRLGVYLPT